MFRLFFLSFLPLFVACGPETASLQDALHMEYDMAERSTAQLSVEMSTDDALKSDQDLDGTTVRAYVCIDGRACGWTDGTLDGDTLTIKIPRESVLIGLKVTAWVPATGQTFEGVISL